MCKGYRKGRDNFPFFILRYGTRSGPLKVVRQYLRAHPILSNAGVHHKKLCGWQRIIGLKITFEINVILNI